MITLAILAFSVLTARAQYDWNTQPVQATSAIDPQYICTSNFGTFAAGSSEEPIWLTGNRGNTISATNSIETSANTSVATNHNSVLAVVTWDQPNLLVRLWSNDGSTSEGILNMQNTTCLDAAVPSVIASMAVPSVMGNVERIETNMDSHYLYIGFETNQSDLGYAIYDIVNHTTTIGPSPILDPNNQQAVGTSLTVACYKWSTSNMNSHFSYVWPGNSVRIPVDFQPPIAGAPLPGTILAIPTGVGHLEWLRVVCADNVSGPGITHWFYGTNTIPAAALSQLWGGNGVVAPTLISSALEPGLAQPPMAVGDPYHNWTEGVNPGQSVFLVWPDISVNNGVTTTILKICRQFGWDVIGTPLFTSQPGVPVRFFTVGCNQMGILSIFDGGGQGTQIWRSFYPFDQDVQENTMATAYNQLGTPNEMAEALSVHPGDSLRIYAAQANTDDEFQFENTGLNLYVGYPYNSPDFNAADPRAEIRFDNGAKVEFQESLMTPSNGIIQIEARGSMLEEGASFLNMNENNLFATGNLNTSDTTEMNRALLFFDAPFNASPGTGQVAGFSGGGGFVAEKAQMTWAPSSGDPYPNIFNVNGPGTFVKWDTTFVYFGPTNTSGSISENGLVNLQLNGSSTDNGEQLMITNCMLTDGVQANSQGVFNCCGMGGIPSSNTAERADILAINPSAVTCSNNNILYCDLRINDPVSSVDYNNNNISIAKQGIEFEELGLPGSEAISSSFTMNVNGNHVFENWPIGSSTDPATDFYMYGFSIPDGNGDPSVDAISVDLNTFGAQAEPPSFMVSPASGGPGSWAGLFLDGNTTAQVVNNTFTDRNPAIHSSDPSSQARPLLCTNTITGYSTSNSFGLQQDGNFGGAGFTKLNTVTKCAIAFLSDGYDQSNLLNNFLNNNTTALQFAGYSKTLLNGNHTGGNDYPGQNQLANNTGDQIVIASFNAQPIFGGPAADLNNQGLNSIVSGAGQAHMRFTGTLPPGVPEYILGDPNTYIGQITGNLWSPGLANGYGVQTDAALTPGVYWMNIDNGTASISNYTCGNYINRRNGNPLPLSVASSDTSDTLYLLKEGLSWAGNSVDLQHGIDTLRLFCRRHPFADSYLIAGGEAFSTMDLDISLQSDTAIPGEAHAYYSPHKCMVQYNWYVDQQPLNIDPAVQKDILHELMGYAAGFDRNLACNLSLNFMRLYGDSLWKATCWSFDSSVRVFMHRSEEDTTAFYPVTLPLSHYLMPDAVTGAQMAASTSLSLSPNPVSSKLTIDYSLAQSGEALLLIYNETGNTVRAVVNGPRAAGPNEVSVPLGDVPNGHYFVRLASGGNVITKELIVQH